MEREDASDRSLEMGAGNATKAKTKAKAKSTKSKMDGKVGRSDQRSKFWAIIVYPDSAPDDWLSIIKELHVQAAISPLHDMDLRADGTPKKSHYHVLLNFDSVKSPAQMEDIAEILHAPYPERVQSLKGYARYLTHMDDPDKAQYDADDVILLSGFDRELVSRSKKERRYDCISEMIRYVKETNTTELVELLDYAVENENEWFRVLCDGGYNMVNAYISSNRHKRDRNVQPCRSE